ncbi:50S ribosomal protein L10 [Patescibacteria group bacterium]|nr:50S ribosomal protein L10 [Patescibacteria group bacterium]
MAITKNKKKEVVAAGSGDIDKSKALIFADFSGTNVTDINSLRAELRGMSGKLSIIKKRLLGVIFKEKKINYDPLQFDGQVGTIFVEGELSETAGSLYRFAKGHEDFKLLGAYDLEKKEEINGETINAIGSLPPREILLGQVVGTIAAPIRSLLYILSEKSKQT